MGPEKDKVSPSEREIGLTDRAYQIIKEAIVDYRLKPGAALGLRSLAASLKMSHTPVREALLRLEQEQFVDRRDNKGFMVASFAPKQVGELYDLRFVLEVAGVGWAAERLDQEVREKLEQALDRAESLLREGSRNAILEQEYRFHSLLLEAAGNRPLKRTTQVVLDRIRLVQNLGFLAKDRLVLAHRQHQAIFRAMVEGDPPKAAALMENHLRESRDHLFSRLENEDDILSRLLTGLPGQGFRLTTD